jgi:hypothetical protein
VDPDVVAIGRRVASIVVSSTPATGEPVSDCTGCRLVRIGHVNDGGRRVMKRSREGPSATGNRRGGGRQRRDDMFSSSRIRLKIRTAVARTRTVPASEGGAGTKLLLHEHAVDICEPCGARDLSGRGPAIRPHPSPRWPSFSAFCGTSPTVGLLDHGR